MGEVNNVINATNDMFKEFKGIKNVKLEYETELVFSLTVNVALEEIAMATDPNVRNERLAAFADYLMDFTIKLNRSRILVDIPELAKQIILKSAKEKEGRKVEAILLMSGKLVYEPEIMKMFPSDFFFDSVDYQAENISLATLNLTKIYTKFYGLTDAFDSIGNEAIALIQESVIDSAMQVNKLIWYMSIALKEKAIPKGYEEFITSLLKKQTLKYLQATKDNFLLCLSPELYQKIELTEAEEKQMKNLLNLKTSRPQQRACNAKLSASKILDFAREKKANILIVDVPEVFDALPNDKEIRIALYDHEKLGVIYDKAGRHISKASLILSLVGCH